MERYSGKTIALRQSKKMRGWKGQRVRIKQETDKLLFKQMYAGQNSTYVHVYVQ